jgi:putative component of membrane protein insertase Oxa1/YidC/SpoIIIJ protein YidD
MKWVGIIFLVYVLLAWLICIENICAQSTNDAILKQAFLKKNIDYQPVKSLKHRSVMKTGTVVQKLNPLRLLSTGAMFFYQNVLSDQIRADCNYKISCSEFTKKSIERHGLFKGTLRGIHQLTNCTNGIDAEYPYFLLTPDYKIINSIEE